MRVTKEIPSFFNEVLNASFNDWRKSVQEKRPFEERLIHVRRMDAAISNLVERQKEYL
jgi:hypothetical protein